MKGRYDNAQASSVKWSSQLYKAAENYCNHEYGYLGRINNNNIIFYYILFVLLVRSVCLCPDAFSLSGLARPTSQILNVMHKFSELVLVRMSLLINQSCSVLQLRSAKAREFGELWRYKYTHSPWIFPFKLARASSFRPDRPDRWE